MTPTPTAAAAAAVAAANRLLRALFMEASRYACGTVNVVDFVLCTYRCSTEFKLKTYTISTDCLLWLGNF